MTTCKRSRVGRSLKGVVVLKDFGRLPGFSLPDDRFASASLVRKENSERVTANENGMVNGTSFKPEILQNRADKLIPLPPGLLQAVDSLEQLADFVLLTFLHETFWLFHVDHFCRFLTSRDSLFSQVLLLMAPPGLIQASQVQYSAYAKAMTNVQHGTSPFFLSLFSSSSDLSSCID